MPELFQIQPVFETDVYEVRITAPLLRTDLPENVTVYAVVNKEYDIVEAESTMLVESIAACVGFTERLKSFYPEEDNNVVMMVPPQEIIT